MTLARLTTTGPALPWADPNSVNLVAQVSLKTPVYYSADASVSKGITVLAIDVGIKNNQIRCFLKRGVNLKIVPWDYDFLNEKDYVGKCFMLGWSFY